MKTIYVFLTTLFLFGCGYSQSQTRVNSSPAGMRVRESANCVGFGCGQYSGAGYGYWAMGPVAGQGLSSAWGRLGMIEAYRAQNRWVMSPSASGNVAQTGGSRDPRLDRLVPHLRRMANAMCQNGTLTGDDCVSYGTAQASPAPAQSAATVAPTGAPAPQTENAPQTATPPAENAQEGASGHQRRRPITADELE